MKKYWLINIVTAITLIIVCGCTYSLLLQDNFLHTSISSIILRARHLEVKAHLIVLGFLPIYIGAVIFGSVMLGIYVGSSTKQLFERYIKKAGISQKNPLRY